MFSFPQPASTSPSSLGAAADPAPSSISSTRRRICGTSFGSACLTAAPVNLNDLVADAVSYLKRYYTSILDKWAVGRLYVVTLARLVNEPLLLPTSLLLCCTLDKESTRGFAREDGTRATLSLDDIGQCFAAHTRLTKQMVLILFYIFEPNVSIGCAEPSESQVMLHNAPVALRKVADPDVFLRVWTIVGLCELPGDG
ncbi:hypothetical protein VTO73DRAFT_11740 [Trametes versicolor]